MKNLLFIPLFLGFMTGSSQVAHTQDVAAEFQRILESYVQSDEKIHGALMHIESPSLGISWTGATGIDDLSTQSSLSADQPFRMASVTKTYVAAAILRLIEQEKLQLNDSISNYISAEHKAILEEDGYDVDSITISHLLTHTSGLFDYAVATDAYAQAVTENPSKRWTRTDQLNIAVEYGDSKGPSGYQYHYSDTGYILLGEALEHVTGQSLAAALRSLLKYDELGLTQTWLESLEPAPEGAKPRVHQYFQGIDIHSWDPSMDLYGGGGLVASTSDIAGFFYKLFNDEVFDSPATLELMTSRGDLPMYDPANNPSEETLKARYRHGLSIKQLFGMQVYAHTGFWGVIGAYIPEIDTAVSICVPSGKVGVPAVMKAVEVIRELQSQ